MRPKRTDSNQSTLVKQIRTIPGVSVVSIHEKGQGVPDLLVGHRNKNYLLEIKDPSKPPSKRRLTPDEETFHQQWNGQIAVVHTLEDVLRILET